MHGFMNVKAGLHSEVTSDIFNANREFITYSMDRVFLEKLTDFQLVKKFSAFYGTRRFIAAFTSDRHLCLS
jgi:hypothetical protein